VPKAARHDVETVRSWIDETDRIVVLTGADISTDLGRAARSIPRREEGALTSAAILV
jgi:hypothetical protein